MLRDRDIIYIGNQWFSENKTSSHHIAELLAEKNRVLYIEASGQRAPRASKRDIKKIWDKIRKGWKNPVLVRKNLYLFSPVIIPFHKYKIIDWINEKILEAVINRAGRKIGFRSPLLWILLPHFSSVIGKLNEKGVVYYCVDEYSSQPGVDSEAIKRMERYVLDRADIVFAVSEKLYQSKRKINDNTFLSLHGVNFKHFVRAKEKNAEIPDDIARIQKPIAGFYGLIAEWIDLELIAYLASRLEHISFVLIGHVAVDTAPCNKRKNIHFLGPKPYDILPDYLRAFDVCLLPYKLNTQVINSNPKKLREYLAGGKPVVSVRVTEVERYRDIVYIADSYDDFVRYITLSMNENSDQRMMARIKAMEKESWEYRVEQVCNKINEYIS